MKRKIFLYCLPQVETKSVLGYAISEDGIALGSHQCESVTFAKHDLGLTSNRKHDLYRKHFPGGYELEWIALPEHHSGLALALQMNLKRAMAGDTPGKPLKGKPRRGYEEELREWQKRHERGRKAGRPKEE